VWQDVLPVSIYCKAMGNLLNTAIAEVIAKVMMLEVRSLARNCVSLWRRVNKVQLLVSVMG